MIKQILLLCGLILIISFIGECQNNSGDNRADLKLRLQLLKGEK